MYDNTVQLNRRRFLNGTAVALGATMLAGMAKREVHAAPVAAPAGALLIDNFTSGLDNFESRGTDTYMNAVSGSMLRGHRFTKLQITENDREQPVSMDTGSGYFNLSAGVGAYYGITIAYGIRRDGIDFPRFPLDVDLSACTALRLRFAPISILGSLRVVIASPGAHVNYDDIHIDLNVREWVYECPISAFVPGAGTIDPLGRPGWFLRRGRFTNTPSTVRKIARGSTRSFAPGIPLGSDV